MDLANVAAKCSEGNEAYADLPISKCVNNSCVKNTILKHMSWCQELMRNMYSLMHGVILEKLVRVFKKRRHVILNEEFKTFVFDDI